MRALSAGLLPLVILVAACSAPPQKEIDQAQGGLDAARAAGAELYATDVFTSASAALQQAHDAVAQRDYRLALTRALDANARAQEAARGAADGKARARSDAERTIAATEAALLRLQQSLAALPPRAPKAAALAAQRLHRDAGTTLQKARAAASVGDYLSARDTVKGLEARIMKEIPALQAAVITKPAAPPRRRR